MKTGRRDFLKISAIGITGFMAAGNSVVRSYSSTKESNKIPTYCEVCFWKCAGWAYIDDDNKRILKLTGNENDPLCEGRLCPRGAAGPGMYHDPDRLKVPLIRKIKDNKQYYEEASWPEAIDYIAARIRTIQEEDGVEALALFNHGTGGKHFSKLLKALGSGNEAAPSYAQCRGPREIAFESTFGKGVGSPEPLDIKNCQCLVLLGSHLGENMHNSQVQELAELIEKKGKIITVDPRFSTVASKSNIWMPIKASTDIALMLGWMHVLIKNEWYDKEYVETLCFGFEDLAEHVEDYSPEEVSRITGLKAEQIIASAKMMAEAAPSTIIHPGRHVTWYGDDTQRVRAIAILNALLGSYGRKGGIFFPQAAKVPTYPHPAYPKPEWTWKDNFEGEYSLAKSAISNAMIHSSIIENEPEHLITGWFVVGSNLIQTIPDQANTIKAIQDLKLLVVVDTMPSEITGYADVVLPECTYLERYDDLRVSGYRNASVALRKPAMKPAFLSKPAHWIARKIGYKFGLQMHFNYTDYDDVLEWQVKKMGLSYTELEEKGVIKFPFKEEDLYISALSDASFNTTTGLIELYSFALEDEGHDPMPVYTPHPEPPEGFYRLNYGRAPMHTFSRTQNNRYLFELFEENPVWINPATAAALNLENGEEIYLVTPGGLTSEFTSKVRVTERIGKDSVYMVHGFGKSDKRQTKSFARGISDTALMENVAIDPICGSTGMRGNFVKPVKKSKIENT